jgi:hypothetical protein
MRSPARAWNERVVTRASHAEPRTLRLREPTGADELALDGVDTRAAAALLGRLADPPGLVAELAAGDRDGLLASLHRSLWGDRILTSLECAGCGAMYDLSFILSSLQRQIEQGREKLTGLGGRVVEDESGHNYRLPSAAEEEAAADLGIAAGRQRLAEAIGGENSDADAIDARLEGLAPLLDVDLDAPCAECGHPALARFDIQTFTLQRLLDERDTILAEVDMLAAAYGWSLGEILGLGRSLRRAFAERAGGVSPFGASPQ